MKKFISLNFTFAMLLTLTACNKPAQTELPDNIGKEPKPVSSAARTGLDQSEVPDEGTMGTVTILGEEYDIASTTRLDLRGCGVDDDTLKEIAPLIGQLVRLDHLELSFNEISDLSLIADLENISKLDTLALKNNNISDIAPLEKFTELTRLYLDNNSVSDISALGELTKLAKLGLERNEITDISPLAKLSDMEIMSLDGNGISDLAPLGGLKSLTYLGLGKDFDIDDIEQLGKQLPGCEIYY